MFVGIADTFTVSFSSEADVSGVSLVTIFNTVLIFLFTVLTTGGAVISQYIGSKREEDASRTSGQLLMISAVVPLALTVLIVACRVSLLRLCCSAESKRTLCPPAKPIFSSQRFLCRSFLAVYNAGTAFCCSIGKTNVTMYVHFHCGKRHQRCQKLRRRFCPSNGCGGRCLSFIDFRYSLRRGCRDQLFG